jgi:hypothetical protein
MNWKLIGILSGVGIALGFVFLYVEFGSAAQWAISLGTAAVFAVLIARLLPEHHFLNGFMVGLIQGTVSGLITGLMWDTFMEHHPLAAEKMEEAVQKMEEAGQSGEWIISLSRYMAMLGAPLGGAVNGLVVGMFSWLASKVIRPIHPLEVEPGEPEIPPDDLPPPPS